MRFNYEIYVEGKVQGVGFRYFARAKAEELQLTGFTRNCLDGKVRVVAEGEENCLSTFVDYLRMGPARARVDRVVVSQSAFTGSYSGFTIT